MCWRVQHGATGGLRVKRQLRPQHRRQRRAASLLASRPFLSGSLHASILQVDKGKAVTPLVRRISAG